MADETMYLREMGLSEYEATTYVHLYRLGTSTAKEIASAADVPQSRVYDVLDSLEEKGFVKIQPGRPKKYGTVSPSTALEQFQTFKREQQKRKLADVRELGEEFVDSLSTREPDPTEETDISWSYPNRHYILEELERLTADTESEILMMTTPESFERILTHHGELLARRRDAGVEIKALVATDRGIDAAVRSRACEVMDLRRVEDIHGRLYLYDEEDVLLAYHGRDEEGYVGVSTVSNHLYTTLAHLFEVLWRDGRPVSESRLDS